MAGGGRVQIHGANDLAQGAYVVNNRLLVDTGGGGGPASNVNISSVGGVLVTSPLPVLASQGTNPWVVSGAVTVSGTVAVSSVGGTVAVTQSTNPWVVSGTVNIGTGGPILVDQNLPPWSVSVTAVVPGVLATNLGKAEDALHTSGDVGVMALGVRQDTAAALAANADYIPFTTDALGNLRVGGASATGLGKAEDAVHGSGDVGVMALGVRNDALTPLAADGDYIPAMMDSSGRIQVAAAILSQIVISSIVPGTAAANLGKAEDAIAGSGDTGVAVWAVRADTAAASAANGDYIQFSTDALGNLRVGGASTSGLGKAEDAAHASGDVGVMALAVRRDVILPALAADGDYIPLITDPGGSLRVNATEVGTVTPGFGAANLGKSEDLAHTTGDLGVMSLAVRRDALVAGTSSPSADNDYATINVDSVGALWVRLKGDTVTTLPFSASTRGRPVQIVATATAGTTIHTATTTAGQLDKIYMQLCNTSAAAVTVTIEFGTTGLAANIDIEVPANETVVALDGVVIGGAATDTIAAFASTASVVNAVGRVERLVA